MNKSFTLIEILIVIVVIGILSSFIFVGMSSITSEANIAKGKVFINSIDNSLLLGRISQWKFDELTTAKELQSIGDTWNSNNGILYTGSDSLEKLSSNCPSGNCLSFDGVNDYINTGTVGSLGINEQMSFLFGLGFPQVYQMEPG
ncbi:MAG: prepilin-type N-terminal cleavage/methylation domain-containing protein [Candidatus Pacebacteria bacterium]|nr:prepilin-type N-terminal cleavage/methylation domain-containing protein [Candidatus Paceibacterota bacterium]MDD5013439.1 prepilin-type N-terminal cleavage/methylation domain-containing protein [Candidatus Paceibacterota bacterium]MDD5753060.1 prepilin-type N-terminal cleavage/methylation domain-containing protein [Candidatus Paceibacterota bacterium]